jgi:hypothetical protein
MTSNCSVRRSNRSPSPGNGTPYDVPSRFGRLRDPKLIVVTGPYLGLDEDPQVHADDPTHLVREPGPGGPQPA